MCYFIVQNFIKKAAPTAAAAVARAEKDKTPAS